MFGPCIEPGNKASNISRQELKHCFCLATTVGALPSVVRSYWALSLASNVLY